MASDRLPYIRSRGVETHSGNILVLAVAEDGKTLASGGKEGTRIWSTAAMNQLKRPSEAGSRGATCSLLWVHQTDEPRDVLYSGTQNGFFFAWRPVNESFEETFALQMTNPSEITGLAFDTTNNRLCICSRNSIIQSWTILKDPMTGTWSAQNIFSQKYTNLSPRAIMFDAFDNTKDRDIFAFGLHNNGPVYNIRGQTGELVSQWSVGASVGDAAVNWREGILCLDDPASGPTLFRLTDRSKVRACEIPRERQDEIRARHVRFAENGLTVISGSDHGVVYVFETRTGDVLQKLEIGISQWVQAVAAADIDGVPVVFAALTRADGGWEEIFVWKRARSNKIGLNKVGAVVNLFVVLGFLAFLYQNLGGYVLARIAPGAISGNSDVGARQDVGPVIHKDVVYL
ncbi:quinon protein alcohol dehydrogenase-like superfamily [Mycena polygramma]|nr:quinon protein alcohol dehydrogenase-like superfamily [Mycena polygramma]